MDEYDRDRLAELMRQAFIDGNAKDVALTLVRELIHGTSDAIKVTAAKYGINLA